jgi:hypothetical protein
MAIHKRVHRQRNNNEGADAAQPVFAYPATDALATVVTDAWINGQYLYDPPNEPQRQVNLREALLDRDKHGNPSKMAVFIATKRIREAGIDLDRAVVISEEEHDKDYFMQDDTEVVFVLPNVERVRPAPPNLPPVHPVPQRLLDTAKLLMACTPNGI